MTHEPDGAPPSQPVPSAAAGPARKVGRYRVHGIIGRGGMAAVHLGRLRGAAGFTRVVAIKRLHDSYATDPAFVAMFTDEARLSARIRHPNVVSTLDVVASELELFHVMDYVHGETVARLVATTTQHRGRVPVDVAVRVVSDALLGLHAAHETADELGHSLGLVHRDVSPQNIIVGADGVSRVLDFGVAKARGQSRTTGAGGIKGKVGYMPPEQLYGERVDRRADVYAAGVVLWELLTCKRLFVGQDGNDAVAVALTAPVWRPSVHNDEIPDELDDLVLRALNREREKRFASAEEMAEALVTCVSPAQPSKVAAWIAALAGPTLAQRARMVAAVESEGDTSDGGVEGIEPRDEHRSLLGEVAEQSLAYDPAAQSKLRRSRAVGFLVGLLLVAAGGWFVWRGYAAEAPAQAPDVMAVPASSPSLPDVATSQPTAVESAPTPEAPASVTAKPPAAAPHAKPPHFKPHSVPKVSCNPPYELDENGHRRYKRECLR